MQWLGSAASVIDERRAHRSGTAAIQFFNRPIRIAIKGAASRGRTQLCQDIFNAYVEYAALIDRESVIHDSHFQVERVPFVSSVGYFFRGGMRYAAAYGHEETFHVCRRIAETTYIAPMLSFKDMEAVASGPLTTVFESLLSGPMFQRHVDDTFANNVRNLLVHAVYAGQAEMTKTLYARAPFVDNVYLKSLSYQYDALNTINGCTKKHEKTRITPEELTARELGRRKCIDFIDELVAARLNS